MIVKICGNTRREDLIAADEAGADMLGVVVEVPASKRSQSRESAVELFATSTKAAKAMLLCNHSDEDTFTLLELIKPDILHLTGEETSELVKKVKQSFAGKILKSVHLPASGEGTVDTKGLLASIKIFADAGVDLIVLDASDPSRKLYGGTGSCCDWDAASIIVKQSPLPVLLAGGINPDNVCEAIGRVHPYGVDMASGVEKAPGIKDASKINQLFVNIRECEGGDV